MKKIFTTLTLIALTTMMFGQIDLSIRAMNSPAASGVNMGMTNVVILVQNRGAQVATNVPVELWHNGNLLATEQVPSVSVYGGPSSENNATFTFTQKVDLSEPGQHTVKVAIKVDGNAPGGSRRDTMSRIVTNNVVAPPYAEGFEATADSALPEDWKDANNEASKWVTSANVLVGQGTQGSRSGKRYAAILANELGNDSWFFSPGIRLKEGVLYNISFWCVVRGMGETFDKFSVHLGKGQSGISMTQELYVDEDGKSRSVDWTYVSVMYTPTETDFFNLGFHYYTTAGEGYYAAIDDVEITEQKDNELLISAAFPEFARIPTFQFPSQHVVHAKNVGLNEATNVKLTAKLNRGTIGVSEPVASLAANETAENLTVESNYGVREGENTLVYTVSGDQENEGNRNTMSFTFNASANEYAMDDAVDFATGIGGRSRPLTLGNIFEIFHETTMTKYLIGFCNATVLDYEFYVYRMTGETTYDSVPVLKHLHSRMAKGFVEVDVPDTKLTPGRYFVAAAQLTAENLGIAADRLSHRTMYVISGGRLQRDAQWGAIAIRLILEGGQTDWQYDPPVDDDPNAIKPVVIAPEVNIFPNPVDNELFFQTSETIKRVDIYNLNGALVRTAKGNILGISVADLSAGFYTLRFTMTNGAVSTQKFVKK